MKFLDGFDFGLLYALSWLLLIAVQAAIYKED